MKKYIILCWGLLAVTMCIAQQNSARVDKREQIENVRKEFVTHRIHLQESQEKDFWEIYEGYIQEKIRLRRQTIRIRKNNFTMTATDEQLLTAIDKIFGLKEQELQLEKETKGKLLKVITPRQLAELYRSEQEFIKELVKISRRNGRKK